MIKYVNRHTVDTSKGETTDQPSLTVPDMSLPLKTLLERYTRGGTVATLTPVYNGEEEYPELEKMDKIQKMEALKATKAEIDDIRSDLQKRQNEEEKLKAEELQKKEEKLKEETPKKPDSKESAL